MMKFTGLSIKQKLTASLFLAVLSSTILVGFIGQWSARSLVSERLLEIELPNILWQIRNQIDGDISQLQSATEQLASSAFVRDWIVYGDASVADGEQRIIRNLRQLKQQYDLSNVSVADRNAARYWNHNGFLRKLRRDDADGWFYAFRDSGAASLKSLYTENGTTTLFINYQQVDGRVLAGVGRSVNQMVSELNNFKIADTGFVFLTDAEGAIQIHKEKRLLQQNISRLYDSKVGRALLNKSAFQLEEIELDGVPMYVASSYIESADWYVIAQVPVQEIFAELDDSLTQMLFWVLLVSGGFALIAAWLARQLAQPIIQLADVFAELGKAEANLDVRLEQQESPELKLLQQGFNAFVEKIQATVERVADTSTGLRQEAEEVANSAKLFLERGKQQSEHTEEVVSAISEMGSSVNEVASNANAAADTANELESASVKGKDVSNHAKQSIQQLSEHVTKVGTVVDSLAKHTVSIGSVLEVIRGVSEQTNLLALNAAIEAARAGDMGRGFAVVADEVRSLAKRTADSTDEIQSTIDQLRKEASKAVDLMSNSREQADKGVLSVIEAESALVSITQGISQLRDINSQVATATEEQAQVALTISENLRQIQTEIQDSVNASGKVAQASETLQELSEQLDLLVDSYRS